MTTAPSPIPPTPASHWYTSVWHFLKHVDTYVSDAFVKIFGSDAAHAFAVGAESILKTDLGKIVTVAVAEANSLSTGADKKAAAFSKIMTAVSTQGLNVKESLVNLLIETAVARLKGVFGVPSLK